MAVEQKVVDRLGRCTCLRWVVEGTVAVPREGTVPGPGTGVVQVHLMAAVVHTAIGYIL